jgi:hypothetical protein
MRKLVTATVSAALCLAGVSPAFAQDYRFAGFDAPRGTTATANLRIPLGHVARAKPSYGLSFGMGKAVGAGYDGRSVTRQLQLADIRFTGKGELHRARLASFDLAQLDADKRLNMAGGGDGTLWIVVGIAAAGVAACVAFECFEGDEDDAVPN